MAPKRQTLDGMGVRIRPRIYADVVRRPVQRVIVNDVAPPIASHAKPAHKTLDVAVATLESDAVDRAKQIIHSPVSMRTLAPQTLSVPTPSLPQQENDLVTHEQTIRSMVQSIQIREPRAEISEETEPTQKTSIFKRMFENNRSIAITAMSFVLMLGSVVALVSSFTTNKMLGEQVQALTEVASASIDNESLASTDGMPSEEPVPESVVNAYSPPADEPRYIEIPKLKNKKTRVLKIGLDAEGAIKAPRTTWDTGWYEGSSKFGDSVGSALIVGHVSGLTTGGVFYNLYRVVDGDEIIVEMGDGTKYTYEVVGKEEVPQEGINMNNYLVSKDIDKPGLTLMTSAGEYNPITKTYDNRLAIFAVRVI